MKEWGNFLTPFFMPNINAPIEEQVPPNPMTLKRILIPLWTVFSLLLPLLVSCSDNSSAPDPDEPTSEITDDMLEGLPLFYVNIDSEENRFRVNTQSPIAFESYQPSSHIEMNVVKENGIQYLEPKVIAPLQNEYEVFTGRVINLDDKNIWRNVMILVHDSRRNSDGKSRAGSSNAEDNAFRTVYSDYIGMGTHCFGEPFHKAGRVFNYEHFFDKNGKILSKFFAGTTTKPTTSMVEYETNSLSETSKEWGLNIGITGKLGIPKKEDIHSRSSLNLGITDKTKEVESHEFYLNIYRVKTAEIKMQMHLFEHEAGEEPLASAGELYWLMDSTFVKSIFKGDAKNFNPSKYWDNWGTEVITQASFGGSHTYIYGRQQNAYEHSVSVDAAASVSAKKDSKLDTWIDLWKEKNANLSQYDLGFKYNTSEYRAASKMFEYESTEGGYVSFKDPKEWANGFKENCNWAPISYTTSMDAADDDRNKLYPIESVIMHAIDAYENAFPEDSFSEQDKALIANARAKLDMLINGKEAYINGHVIEESEPKKLVIADFQMRTFDGIKKKGNGEPFVEKDPTSKYSDNYLIYYPMMANSHAPVDNLFPFSTSRYEYGVAAHYQDQIFYYALAPEDQCQGIVDIVFEEKLSECPDAYYSRRGDTAKIGYGMSNKSNYVYVKFFDPEVHKSTDKITAVAIVAKTNRPTSGDIYASSGGAERKPAFTQSEKGKWEVFWDVDNADGAKMKWNKTVWFEGGGLIKYNDIWPAYSTKPLPIKKMTDKNVVHPKKY